MVDVSVIIPTYNRAHYLREAIKSVQAQTFQNWELIVVDDGSTDDTGKLVQEYVSRNERIIYIRQENVGCAGPTRNVGIARARGKYVTFLDDDDLWTPQKLEVQVRYMETHPEIGFSYGWFQIFRESDSKWQSIARVPEWKALGFKDFLEVFVSHSTMMIRRSSVDDFTWFDPLRVYAEDYDLCLRLSQRCQVGFIDDTLAFTLMDERTHAGENLLITSKHVIDILCNVRLQPGYEHCKKLVRRQIAKRYYYLAHDFLDQNRYWQAAYYFLLALLKEPLVRFTARKSGEEGFNLLVSVIKSYLTVPVCLVKGLIHARR